MSSSDVSTASYSSSSSEVVVVDFDGDQDHPHDWPNSRKWLIMTIPSLALFLMPLSSTITTPAEAAIAKDFNVTSSIAGPMALSLFLLMYCLGPLLLGPLSELYGRGPVIQLGTIFYLAFNLAGGFSKTMTQLLVFRLFSGIGGSATLAVGASMTADLFRKEERGLPLAVVNMGPVVGSCLGPIAGGFITEYTTWRWTLWSTSIGAGIFLVMSFIIDRETYAPVILQRRKDKLVKEAAQPSLSLEKKCMVTYKTPFEKENESLGQRYRRTLIRPLYFLCTQPIVQTLACYYGYLYGIVYLILASFAGLWTNHYHMKLSTGTLNYIAPCCGYLAGATVCALLTDKIYRYQVARNNGIGKPEFRLPIMIPASFLVPIGLFWYGWTAQYQTHWIIPDIGIALPLMGATIVFQGVSAYLMDTYPIYAASANGTVYILRGLTGFGFPLFSPQMYANLGYGWGNSVLALIALVIGCPIPFILWRYGERLRAASSYADDRK